jgi:sterol 3beta-glucosyltransferase
VLGTGWSVLDDLPVHPNLFVAKYVDHERLLPRCSVAVIHGGIGTVAAVLKSGIPVIVVSILADQPVNGKIIEKRKLGFHIPFKKLTAQNLLTAIDATQNPGILAHCRTTAAHIRSENGIEKAARLIEDYFEEKPRSTTSA